MDAAHRMVAFLFESRLASRGLRGTIAPNFANARATLVVAGTRLMEV
jgi:hypothetical protein